MAVPEQTHSGQLNRSKIVAQPEAGARKMAGKTCEPDSAMTDAKVLDKAPEAVKEVDMNANKGAAYDAMKKQQGSNLPANVWKNHE
jgi:hypothetical protein